MAERKRINEMGTQSRAVTGFIFSLMILGGERMGARVLTTSFFLVSTSVSVHQLLDHLPVQSAKRPFVRDLQGGSMVGVLYGFHKISEATPSTSPPPQKKKRGGGTGHQSGDCGQHPHLIVQWSVARKKTVHPISMDRDLVYVRRNSSHYCIICHGVIATLSVQLWCH